MTHLLVLSSVKSWSKRRARVCQGRLRPAFISHHSADRTRSAHSAVLGQPPGVSRSSLPPPRPIGSRDLSRFFPPYADNFVLLSSPRCQPHVPLIPRHSDLLIIIIPPDLGDETLMFFFSLLHCQHVLCTIICLYGSPAYPPPAMNSLNPLSPLPRSLSSPYSHLSQSGCQALSRGEVVASRIMSRLNIRSPISYLPHLIHDPRILPNSKPS